MTPADSNDVFARLYRLNRARGIRYAAAKIAGELKTNRHILGIEAEELYDEAMEQYFRDGEHLADRDDAEHERCINHRINQRYIHWLRRKHSQKRTIPGAAVELDAERADEDDGEVEPPDRRSQDAELSVDLEDQLARMDGKSRSAAVGRARGDTYKEIGDAADVSEETARRWARAAAEQLADDSPPPSRKQEEKSTGAQQP